MAAFVLIVILPSNKTTITQSLVFRMKRCMEWGYQKYIIVGTTEDNRVPTMSGNGRQFDISSDPGKFWGPIHFLMCRIQTHFQLVVDDYCHLGSTVILVRSESVAKGPRMKVQFDLHARTLQKLKWLQWQSESAARHGLFTVCKCTRGFVYANVVL